MENGSQSNAVEPSLMSVTNDVMDVSAGQHLRQTQHSLTHQSDSQVPIGHCHLGQVAPSVVSSSVNSPLVIFSMWCIRWYACLPISSRVFSSSSWKRGEVRMCKLDLISQEWLKLEVKLLLSANRKSYMRRWLVQQRMTLSDLECLKSTSFASRTIYAVAELLVNWCTNDTVYD